MNYRKLISGKRVFLKILAILPLATAQLQTNMGPYAFWSTNLKAIDLSENTNLTVIANYTFYTNLLLENVKLPNSLEIICDYAFADCSRISEVTIPGSVTEIRKKAFYLETYGDEDDHNILFSDKLQNLTFEESQNSLTIGKKAFFNRKKLQNVKIPRVIDEMGKAAFDENVGSKEGIEKITNEEEE